ncbi:MAG: radical SAM protein [candidate division NC10 bacterium]|nr:radical SAM protein [candidate division NC10 bacterium]
MLFPSTEPLTVAKGIERLAREADRLLEKRQAEYLSIEVRSVLNRCMSPRMPFTWTINPYRGCEFGCRYCYARYTHEFMGLNRWEDFEEKIYVKRDAARILMRELTPERLTGQSIALGTATDPYQPAERRYGATRSLLAVMALAPDLRLSITTKSDLVTRDIDLLRRIAARSSVQVNLTVTTLDRRLARILEFRAPTPDLRLKALRALRQAGIVAGVNIAPIMPDITDTRANLESVIAAARDHDATHVFANVLFLKPSAQHAFFPFLEQHFPHLRKRYATRFTRSAFLDRAYKDRIFGLVAELKQQYGFPDRPEFDPPATIHEADGEQMALPRVEPSPKSMPCVGTSPPASEIGQMSHPRYSDRDKGQCALRFGGCQ